MRKLLLIATCFITTSAFSQDRYFARTYNSNILPKGSVDIEFWHTSRFGHIGQFFHAQDQRMEVEVGLGNNLQTAIYFNRYQQRFSETADGTNTLNEIGFSNEWKYKISGAKRKTGVALYGEWGFKGGDELELETKIIVDRTFGKHLLAFNTSGELEKEFDWENGKVESSNWEVPVELDFAYMYNLNYNTGLGFEIRNQNGTAKGKGWEHSVFFGGPTFNYRGNGWFVIANYLPQWGNVHKTVYAPDAKVLDDHERAEARILIGISLK
jgi:hypothetical protein